MLGYPMMPTYQMPYGATERDAKFGAAFKYVAARTRFERKSTREFETPASVKTPRKKVEGPSKVERKLSLPKAVVAWGGLDEWNDQTEEQKALHNMLEAMCTATTLEEALVQVTPLVELGHYLYAFMYMRMLASKNMDVYYAVLMEQPSYLLPVMYTPTVGEVCQKFGLMPLYRRGCYMSIADRGNLKAVLKEYADAELPKGKDGEPLCDCIVFSDGGRILGLGDLGTWGMGIPLGKLDLYTVCGGVNPHRTIPLILDVGCTDSSGNTAHLEVRDHPLYTGEKRERVTSRSDAGTLVNSCYYGEDSMIKEFFDAAGELFGKRCLLQFEDFNSNDAFPLLAEYREKYLCYNDDIQGTAAVCVAGIMGGIKIKNPACTDLIGALKKQTFLFVGAGSANLGALQLLAQEAGIDKRHLMVTNSRGLIWKSSDGSSGSFRNDEQKEFACIGEPDFNGKNLAEVITNTHPSCIIGAVGVAPNCFTKEVVEAMMHVSEGEGSGRPIIFALSNPKSQAEITAEDAYMWSHGEAIYGSGTWFDPVTVKGREHSPGQVNNAYIFPGVSFGAICCEATKITDSMFLKAAEAVANSLDATDIQADRVVPRRNRVREVALNVATALVLEAQQLSLAQKPLGKGELEVKDKLRALMWEPGKGQ